MGIQEVSVFLACSKLNSRAIAKRVGQLLPNVRMRLTRLQNKGLVKKSGDAIPIYDYTEEGERIIEEINR
jgi:DNA-binding MarR family transcriptional regulator